MGRPLVSPYVGNANLFGVCAEDVGAALDEVCAELDRLNLAYHEMVEPTRLYESVGVVSDGQARKLRHTDKRAWKLYLGLQHLIGVGGATGYALRIIYGHLVNFFMLMRPALAVLDLGYHFTAEHRERWTSGRRGPRSPTAATPAPTATRCAGPACRTPSCSTPSACGSAGASWT
eukprot:1453022-Pyramimonas_sp.AAC.1